MYHVNKKQNDYFKNTYIIYLHYTLYTIHIYIETKHLTHRSGKNKYFKIWGDIEYREWGNALKNFNLR